MANRHIRFLEGIHHGFLVVDVTPERVQTDYVWISSTAQPEDPRLDPRSTAAVGASWQTVKGSRVVSEAAAPLGARSDSPRAAVVPGRRPAAAPAAPRPAAGPTLPTTGPSTAAAALAVGAVGAAVAVRALSD